MSAKIKKISVATPYREETIRIPVLITILAVALITVPLVMWILKINNEGTRSANVARFDSLIASVNKDVRTVRALLGNDAAELAAMRDARNAAVVTLIVPEVVIVEENSRDQNIKPLQVEMDGIYWSPSKPLVSLNGDTYRVGDIIQGYEIISIGKTAVHFQAADGTEVVKDMYDDLLKGSRQ